MRRFLATLADLGPCLVLTAALAMIACPSPPRPERAAPPSAEEIAVAKRWADIMCSDTRTPADSVESLTEDAPPDPCEQARWRLERMEGKRP